MKTKSILILAGLAAAAVATTGARDTPEPPAAQVHTGASIFGNDTDPLVIATPPPALRTETKPPAPDANHGWVPGRYVPVKGEWTWVAGKWEVPPTPDSVWINGVYDPKTHRWSEAHWQPDGIPTPKTEPVKSSPARSGK